ncbi:DUF4129 domain-containing protein [Oceanithermus sp.]
MAGVYALALIIFVASTPPALWPGELIFVLAWALFPRWRTHLAWSFALFTLYLFVGSNPNDAAQMRRLSFLAGELALGILAFSWSAALAENDSFWAPLPFLTWALLTRPAGLTLGLGLLAWAGWQLVRRMRQARDLKNEPFELDARATRISVAFLFLIALALFALGSLKLSGQIGRRPIEAAPPPATAAPGPQAPTTTAPAIPQTIPPEPQILAPRWETLVCKALNGLIDVALLALLVLLSILWWRLLTTPALRKKVDRKSLILVLLAAASLVLAAMWLPLAFPGEGTGASYSTHSAVSQIIKLGPGGQEGAVEYVTRGNWPGALMILASVGVLILILVMIYLVARLLGLEPQRLEAVVPGAGGRRSPEFAGRVRVAYREFLRLMLAYAPASSSETPREYARRLKKRYPRVASQVEELTGLYEPVRYGGLADEKEAARAEELVRLIAAGLEAERKKE